MRKVIEVLVQAWRYPQRAEISIIHLGRSCASPELVETCWRQEARMILPRADKAVYYEV